MSRAPNKWSRQSGSTHKYTADNKRDVANKKIYAADMKRDVANKKRDSTNES